MTTKRVGILLAVIAIGLSGVFFLPKSAAQPFGVKRTTDDKMELPLSIGDWWGNNEAISEKEINTLGKETEFARKTYVNHMLEKMRGYSLLVSMVLSGHDMSNSIHRPERCLDAQGWTVAESEVVTINVPGKGSFSATRLLNRRDFMRDGKKVMKDDKPVVQNAYSYYWFVGDTELTASHWGRYYRDYSDRLLRGVNQRWAFVTVTGRIEVGTNPEPDSRAAAEVDRILRKFIGELAPHIHKDSLPYN